MTTVSSLGSLDSLAPLPVAKLVSTTASNTLARNAAVPSSATVMLGQGSGVQTYNADGVFPAPATQPVWERASNDAITSLMTGNFSTTSQAGRFQGLGAALLSGLQRTGSDFSQSVLRPSQSLQGEANVSELNAAMQAQLHGRTDNQISLTIKTAGGAEVQLTLNSQDNGLAVQVQVTKGTLSSAERDALGGLANAFQGAIDGLAGNPPRLDVSGLTQFDPKVLTSVDLHASMQVEGGTQTLDFHADSQQRSVIANGPSGAVNVSVDMSNLAIVGTADQQAQALADYLAQFDKANSRGHGDASLTTMFEDAFSALNSNYGSAATQLPVKTGRPISLNDEDHSALSGLADFNASMTQTPKSINPMLPGELDTFSYQVSQDTSIQGSSSRDYSIKQQQQSHLTASYHQALSADMPLNLDGTPQSQNYYYTQISDDSSSSTDIAYNDGNLVRASFDESASQSTHVIKYIMGKLEEDTTTPSHTSRSEDLLSMLNSARRLDQPKTALEAAERQQTLSAVHNLVMP
jgi:hypothetical protein